jgi:hypothetical protein
MDCLPTKPLKKRKSLQKFVCIIFGLPMMIMLPKGNLIKWNSVKTANDRKVLWEAFV